MFPTIQHPSRFIWDFWYYYDPPNKLFYVFYLNADPSLVPSEQFHWASQVGYGVTKDFIRMDWGPSDVLTASSSRWDNTSIWTGDIIKVKNGFLLFYTSRDGTVDDGKTQNIGCAFSERIDTCHWEPVSDFRLQPDGHYYTLRHVPDDVSIHSWRDPCLFRHKDNIYMLVTAKSVSRPLKHNGVAGLLRCRDGILKDWEYLPPLANTGFFSEMDVNQVFENPKGGYELICSTGPDYDSVPESRGTGGLYAIHSENLLDFNKNRPRQLLSHASGLYAFRIIPELNGEIVGFDHRTGGIRRSGVKTGWKAVCRDFLDVETFRR